jgi:NADH-quinone oxidoreductase subunit N
VIPLIPPEIQKLGGNEPTDLSPIPTSMPIKVAVFAGIAGTLVLGIYPGPFIYWAVNATLMFSNIVGHTASPPILPGG